MTPEAQSNPRGLPGAQVAKALEHVNMNIKSLKVSITALALLAATFSTTQTAQAHCDSLDGPVIAAARAALEGNDVKLVLIWVKQGDDAAIKRAFEQTIAVCKLNPEARELADMYFFETLVRIHRAGEGVAYTGLKPSGTDFGPSIPATDKALESGDVEPVMNLISDKIKDGVREHLQKTLTQKKFDKNNVQAGREFVKAYVEYTHYVKGIYDSAIYDTKGHFNETVATPSVAHPHKD